MLLDWDLETRLGLCKGFPVEMCSLGQRRVGHGLSAFEYKCTFYPLRNLWAGPESTDHLASVVKNQSLLGCAGTLTTEPRALGVARAEAVCASGSSGSSGE